MFRDLHNGGSTTFNIDVTNSCTTCFNIRLLKVIKSAISLTQSITTKNPAYKPSPQVVGPFIPVKKRPIISPFGYQPLVSLVSLLIIISDNNDDDAVSK